MNKKEFTVDEISCAYCVYYNPVLEDYMHELGYDEDNAQNEGIVSFDCGVKTLKELRGILGEERMLQLLTDNIFDDDYTKCVVDKQGYSLYNDQNKKCKHVY